MIDIDELAANFPRLDPHLRFKIGDVTQKLSGPDLNRVAEAAGVTRRTLESWMKTAREVPAERRDTRISFAVYQELIRIPEPDRWTVLNSRPAGEWSADLMSRTVRDWRYAKIVKRQP